MTPEQLAIRTPHSVDAWRAAYNAHGHRDDWPDLARYALAAGQGPSFIGTVVRALAEPEQPLQPAQEAG